MLDLCGIWKFQFFEGKQIEDINLPDVPLQEEMCVPGCFDVLPDHYCKRGTGVYSREFTLETPCRNAFLCVDGMGLRASFFVDGRGIGASQLTYSAFELETGVLSAGTHTITAAVDNCFDAEKVKLFCPYYDFYAFGGFYHGLSLRTMKRESMIDRVIL